MSYMAFHHHFPEVAEQETRTIRVRSGADVNLPAGEYEFCEMFCDEPGCDCRRVFWLVISSLRNDIEAVIAYGWEAREFYVAWMGDDEPDVIAALKGPALNLTSPQSQAAPALLDLVERVLLKDTAYIERVKRHYGMFREKIGGAQSTDRRSAKKARKRRKP